MKGRSVKAGCGNRKNNVKIRDGRPDEGSSSLYEGGQGEIRPARRSGSRRGGVMRERQARATDSVFGIGAGDRPSRTEGVPQMRQLGDFATWLGMILIVLGAVYYTPKLVQYMSDDTASRPATFRVAARPPGWSSRHNMAMRHGRDGHRPNERSSAN